jgi:hypothetical protein
MIAVLALLVVQGTTPVPNVAVQMGRTVTPDTVTIGDPFVVTLRVRAPRGATVTFPQGPDSAASVDALDSRQVHEAGDTLAADVTARYRLAAWDTGSLSLQLGDVVVADGAQQRRITVSDLTVYVRSVLPADSAQRKPKPARDIFEFPWPWWVWALLALAVAGLIGLFIWWWRRRRRRRAPKEIDPYVEAEQGFVRVEALRLVEAGERGRHVALMVDVVRRFLARRFRPAHEALTTTELLAALSENPHVPTTRLGPLLAEADLIKFARRLVTGEHTRELGADARAIVAGVREAEKAATSAAPPAQERAA